VEQVLTSKLSARWKCTLRSDDFSRSARRQRLKSSLPAISLCDQFSLEDEDRDSSDAKDAILEVAALTASETCPSEIIAKMRVSQYAHFRDAAAPQWPGRRATQLAFEDRVSSAKLDGFSVVDLPLPTLYQHAQDLALRAIEESGSPKVLSQIGRAIYWLRTFRAKARTTEQ
jgi:hypothetical protein